MPAEKATAYAVQRHDLVREELESGFFAALLPRLLAASGGGRLLDLGCGDSPAAAVAGPALTHYTGIDFRPASGPQPGRRVRHDLREGIGPVGPEPFDVYLGTFGVASHLRPAQLSRLLREIAAHGRPGSIVALEALGLHSLEWPRLWQSEPGRARALSYRLRGDVEVHPWAPHELAARHEAAGISPLQALDRSVQAGPKAGDDSYWPGLPPVRDAMNALLEGDDPEEASAVLGSPLPPLPAGPVAAVHHGLAHRRRHLVGASHASGASLARSVWGLEPRSGGGFGHGLTVVGRIL